MVTPTSPRRKKKQQKDLVLKSLAVAAGISFALTLFWMFTSTQDREVIKAGLRRLPIKRPKLLRKFQKEWPPLSAVYDGSKVIADPQFLLDFAILGFEKSGTSTLMKWLGGHSEIQCFQEEIYDVYRNRTGSLVWRLHTQLEPGFQYKRGYKSPVDIFNAGALHLLDQFFPKTRLILALRHPVLYYESLYNFRIQNLPEANSEFIMPLDGIGECKESSQGVCTDHSNFAQWMYRMGKTASLWPSDTERELLKDKPAAFVQKTTPTRNPVFVVELSQLKDDNPTRATQLKHDLKTFLGLTEDLTDSPHAIPGKKWPEDVQAIKTSRKMNICEEQYAELREELMRISRLNSQWIRESFVQSDDVFVSSPEFFEEAMLKWMDDPCDTRPAVQ